MSGDQFVEVGDSVLLAVHQRAVGRESGTLPRWTTTPSGPSADGRWYGWSSSQIVPARSPPWACPNGRSSGAIWPVSDRKAIRVVSAWIPAACRGAGSPRPLDRSLLRPGA